MAKALPNPQDAAQKWANNLGAASQAYTAGVQAVQQAPGQAAANAADRWLANTQAAMPKYKTNSAAVSLGDWQNATVTKGAPRLASGATAAQPKMANVLTQLFPYIEQVRGTLPPRGDIEANINRAAQFARGMAKFQRR